jgi:hypothetical protein
MTVPPMPAAPPSPESGGLRADDSAGRGHSEGGRSLLGLVQRPERRVTIWALIVVVLVAAVCWYFGADAWHSVLIGGVLTTVGLISLVGIPARDPSATDWRAGPSPNREGARGEVAELSWSLRTSYGGRVDIRAVSRVRQLARRRLALHQLDLNDPADRAGVEALIGRSAYAVLVRRERRPMLHALLHCLDALDRLSPTMPTALPSRPRRRASIFVPHRLRRTREH